MPTVALATCAEFPLLDDEDRLLLPALAALGIDAVPAVWTDETIDWAGFDAVVLRETWDYSQDRPAFLAWVHRTADVTRVLNPANVVEWNTDKRYLRDLVAAGLPIVPTVFLEPGDDPESWDVPAGYTDMVVKPAVSAGSRDTIRHHAEQSLATAHAHTRASARRRSHRDGAAVPRGRRHRSARPPCCSSGASSRTRSARARCCSVTSRASASRACSCRSRSTRASPRRPSSTLPGGSCSTSRAASTEVLYARVDLIPGPGGEPLLLELELTEPSLFLSHSAGAPERMAAAIAARL